MKNLRFFSVCILLSFFVGCGPNLKNYYDDINKMSAKKEYEKINTFIEKNKSNVYGEKSKMLYLFDRGYFLHLSGDYENSNKCFTEAKKLYDDYYTKSITTESSALVLNDKVRPYYGDDFEISMLLAFKAINYILLDQKSEAAVEARASVGFLKNLTNNNYSKNVYKDDAFLKYLSGIVFEINKDYNDAFTSYRQALNLYNKKYFNFTPPKDLFDSTVDMAKKLGIYDEIEKLNQNFPNLAKSYKSDKITSELIILHYNGLVPHRISTTLEVSFWKAWANVNLYQANSEEAQDVETASKVVNSIASNEQFVVAFPTYVETPFNIYTTDVKINDSIYSFKDVSNLGDITLQNFNDKKAGIYAKSMARAAIKFALVRAANNAVDKNVENSALSFLLQAGVRTASSLTEDADKRSWRVLPDKIKMARIFLDKGVYSLTIEYKTKDGFLKNYEIKDIEIKPNSKKFVVLHTVE